MSLRNGKPRRPRSSRHAHWRDVGGARGHSAATGSTCREECVAAYGQARCEGAHGRGHDHTESSPRCVSMRTRSGAAKSHRPRHRLPHGLDLPEAGCCWELGVEEVCEEREVRLALRAGLLHRHRRLRAGAYTWWGAWAHMYLDGHVRGFSSSPVWACACGNDDCADVDASCGPRAFGRDTHSWLPRTIFTHAEGIFQRRDSFSGSSATTRVFRLRHHAGGLFATHPQLALATRGCLLALSTCSTGDPPRPRPHPKEVGGC